MGARLKSAGWCCNQRPQMKACALLLLIAIACGQEIVYDDVVPEGANDAAVMAREDLPNAKESTLPNETNDLPSETYDLVQAGSDSNILMDAGARWNNEGEKRSQQEK